jgi:glycerol-3-phosphate acyltransferase PlsY
MANVGHVLGKPAAICSLLGDIAKTFIAVWIACTLFPELGRVAGAWAGLGSTLGHDFPFWHGFKGGKGVTTIATTIIMVAPLWGILAGVVGILAIIATGYLSIAALIGMGFYVVAMLFTGGVELAAISVVFMALQVYGHWSKLKGIANGTTRKAGLALAVRARLRR